MKAGQLIGTCSAVTAISTACFGYLLTWPALLSGAALIAFATSAESHGKPNRKSTKKVIAFNTGLTLSLLSIFFFHKNHATANTNRLLAADTEINHAGDNKFSDRKLEILKNDEPLGYRYKPGTSGRSYKQLAISGKTIYDVTYTIDIHGNRITPSSPHHLKTTNSKTAMFLGGSFTFGEGLEDNETLPYFFQGNTGIKSLNTGMGGHGAHQALKIMEDKKIFNERSGSKNVDFYIYRIIPNHINRATGYSPFDPQGPCYELNQRSKPTYLGSFIDCGKRETLPEKAFEQYLPYLGSKEPWSEALILKFIPGQLLPATLYNKTNYKESDIKRFVAMTRKMKDIASARGAKFLALIEDITISPGNSCGKEKPFASELIKELKSIGITTLPQSKAYSKSLCNPDSPLIISIHDLHPNKRANMLSAQFLANFIGRLDQHTEVN